MTVLIDQLVNGLAITTPPDHTVTSVFDCLLLSPLTTSLCLIPRTSVAMQVRPPTTERYIPPTAPHVPIHAVQSLIPRLATAINDIDGLKAQLAAGNADGSMPSW